MLRSFQVAALFYVGTTKSHPPIPDHLSPEAKDFLLKCLQKYVWCILAFAIAYVVFLYLTIQIWFHEYLQGARPEGDCIRIVEGSITNLSPDVFIYAFSMSHMPGKCMTFFHTLVQLHIFHSIVELRSCDCLCDTLLHF